MCKILDLLWQILFAFGQVFIDENGQILKNDLAISAHCPCLCFEILLQRVMWKNI